jgi:hypothetical protein
MLLKEWSQTAICKLHRMIKEWNLEDMALESKWKVVAVKCSIVAPDIFSQLLFYATDMTGLCDEFTGKRILVSFSRVSRQG